MTSFETICRLIDERLKQKQPLIVAIDGRCAAGKTTLAKKLQEHYHCALIAMDDFFLQPQQRTKERLAQPGGNIDHERFLQEVLTPLQEKQEASYQPYDCQSQSFLPTINVQKAALYLIEGSYACHPSLIAAYDLKLFLTTTPEKQLSRLEKRNPQKLTQFQERWIPLEERYFSAYPVEEAADLVVTT
ncbi:uridine kinase family protein [Enterococcus sp. AZ109]|uniref:uridine kinase family protein n=1 Tax=Enterococcus sp. AZ109 TaxID=2774634 RepID=UPI003F22BAD6